MPDRLWGFVGLLLALWVGYDLYAGYTYIHRPIIRAEETALYWIAVGVWTSLAIWCLSGFLSSE